VYKMRPASVMTSQIASWTEAMTRHSKAKPVSGTTLPRWCLSIVPNVPLRAVSVETRAVGSIVDI
jgi:hypothetical protein